MVQARDLNNHTKQYGSDPACADAAAVMRNCAIESFLLHYRSLREFFNGDNKTKVDDIKAFDYLPTWKSSAAWVNDKTEASRIHKRLAHISTLRKTLDNNWDLAIMERNVFQTLEDFIATLAPEQKSWFSNAVTILKQHTPPSVAMLGDASHTLSVTRGTVTFPRWSG